LINVLPLISRLQQGVCYAMINLVHGTLKVVMALADVCMPSLLASLYDGGNLIYSPRLKKDAEDLSKFKYISTRFSV
jgi:hypothetical protein